MTKPKFLTDKFIESAVRFLVYFLAVALTPFLARPTAHIWDWVAYGALHRLFTEIHTVFFWLFETIAFHYIGKALAHKGRLPSAKEEKPAPSGDPWKPMPRKNLWILTGITVGCVLLVSAIIGFKVKPFYDLGEKVTGYDIWCTVGTIGKNAFQCMWAFAMFLNGLRMADEIVRGYALSQKPWLRLLIGGGFLMIFGLFDIFTAVISYPLGWRSALLGVAYAAIYAVYPVIYYYAEECRLKSYLLMAFIYLF